MGKSSKKSITRTSTRPARRARRNESAATDATAAVLTTAADEVTPTAPEAAAPEVAPDAAAPETAAQPETPQVEVAQLAFHYYAESGYVQGHALDHWLRAESTLRRD